MSHLFSTEMMNETDLSQCRGAPVKLTKNAYVTPYRRANETSKAASIGRRNAAPVKAGRGSHRGRAAGVPFIDMV